MTLYGWLQILAYFLVLVLLAKPLGQFYGEGVPGRTYLSHARSLARWSGCSTAWPAFTEAENGLENLCHSPCCCSASSAWSSSTCSSGCRAFTAQPAGDGRSIAGPVAQYRRQLRDQHQLAKLRRRSDDELPDPDAGHDGAELYVGGSRYRHRGGFYPRFYPSQCPYPGQLLGRSDPRHLYILLPLAIVVAMVLVSQGVVQTFSPTVNATLAQSIKDSNGQRGHHPANCGRTGGIADRHQTAGHQWRRVLQRQCCPPFENPTPLQNFVLMLSQLVIGASLTYTFGKLVGDTRQGWTAANGDGGLLVGFYQQSPMPQKRPATQDRCPGG